jgi:hypothetical protein
MISTDTADPQEMTMSTLIRDVLLPSAAAIGLLVNLTVGPARAGDEPNGAEPAAIVAAAEKPEPGEFEARMPRTSPAGEIVAASETDRPSQRCRRVERIGKTSARRCP